MSKSTEQFVSRNRRIGYAALFCCLLPLALGAGPFEPAEGLATDYRAKWAIIIGVDGYDPANGFDPLKFAANDARAFAELLRDEFGYDDKHTRFVRDEEADWKTLKKVFTTDLKALPIQPEDALLVFFAGHGTDDGRLAARGSRSDDPKTCLALTDLKDCLAEVKCRHKLVILDCCFSGNLFSPGPGPLGGGAGAAGAAAELRPPARADILVTYLEEAAFLGMSAGRKTTVADGPLTDGAGEHSVFTLNLLQVLRERADSARPDGAFTFREVAARVEGRVRAALLSRQVPDWGRIGPGSGDFVFRPTVWRMTPAEESRRRMYTIALNAAHSAWEYGDPGRVVALLESQRPAPGQRDLRGFEWYYLWRLTHTERRVLHGHGTGVQAVRFTADGQTLISVAGANVVKFWDPEKGRIRKTLEGEESAGYVPRVLAPDGRFWATGGADVVIWDGLTGRKRASSAPPRAEPAFPLNVGLLGFSGDGELLVWAGQRPANVTTKETFHAAAWRWAKGPAMTPLALAFRPLALGVSPDGRTAAIAGEDKSVRLWDTSSGKEQGALTGPAHNVWALAFSADGRTLAAGTEGGELWTWDLASRKGRAFTGGDTRAIGAISFAPGGALLATGGFEVKLWDAAQGKHLTSYRRHVNGALALCFSPDGQTLASGGPDNVIRLWDLGARQGSVSFPAHAPYKNQQLGQPPHTLSNPVRHVLPSPAGTTLATQGQNGEVTLWNLSAGRTPPSRLWQDRLDVAATAFSRDGKLFAVAFNDSHGTATATGEVKVCDTAQGRLVKHFAAHQGGVSCLEFSPDARTLATGGRNGEVSLWSVGTWKLGATLKGDLASVKTLAFSPTSPRSLLAAGGLRRRKEGAVELWNLSSHALWATLRGHGGEVRGLSFNRDGTALVTTGEDRALGLWDVAQGAKGRRTLLADVSAAAGPPFANPGHYTLATFAPSGRYLAAAGPQTILTLDAARGRELAYRDRVASAPFHIVQPAFGPDDLGSGEDRTLATGEVASVCLRDAVTLQERFHISMPALGGRPIAFTADGRTLVAGNSDGQVTLVYAAQGDPPRLLDELLTQTRDPDPQVRRNAADALGGLGREARETVLRLREMSRHDPDRDVRLAALAALVSVGWREQSRRDIPSPTPGGQAARSARPGTNRSRVADGSRNDHFPDLRAVRQEVEPDDDPGQMVHALLMVCVTAQKGSVDVLVMALEDPDPVVRKKAVEALAKLRGGAKAALPALLKIVRADDEELAVAAYRAAGAIDFFNTDAGEALLARFKTHPLKGAKEVEVAIAAAAMRTADLGAAGRRVAPHLAEVLRQSKSKDLCGRLIAALKRLGPRARAAAPALRGKLSDEGCGYHAAEVLFRLDPADKSLHAPLVRGHVQALKGPFDSEWMPVLSDLGLLGPAAKDAVPVLTEIAKSGRLPWNRTEAEVALRRIQSGGKSDVQVLIELMRGNNRDHRAIAIREVERHGPGAREAVPVLREKLADPDHRFAAARALLLLAPDEAALHPQLIPPLVERLQKELDIRLAIHADVVRRLGRMGPAAAAAVPVLRDIARASRSGEMRTEAELALRRIQPQGKENLEILLDCVTGDSPDVRSAALEELARPGPHAKDAVAPLRKILKDAEDRLRAEILQTLEEIEAR